MDDQGDRPTARRFPVDTFKHLLDFAPVSLGPPPLVPLVLPIYGTADRDVHQFMLPCRVPRRIPCRELDLMPERDN
jgi:hypothetical protein